MSLFILPTFAQCPNCILVQGLFGDAVQSYHGCRMKSMSLLRTVNDWWDMHRSTGVDRRCFRGAWSEYIPQTNTAKFSHIIASLLMAHNTAVLKAELYHCFHQNRLKTCRAVRCSAILAPSLVKILETPNVWSLIAKHSSPWQYFICNMYVNIPFSFRSSKHDWSWQFHIGRQRTDNEMFAALRLRQSFPSWGSLLMKVLPQNF